MNSPIKFIKLAAPLLLVLFIDGMGLGLVIPVLNGLLFDPNSAFLMGNFSNPIMHNVIYGLIIGIFMLSWFFGAAFLGDLSDRIGRKKSLLICLGGAFLSYLLSAISVSLHSLMLLLIGRIIGGLTSGSQPIAQAAIVDMSEPAEKSRNIGFILLSLSLGFILGPLFGGILADNRIVSWFNFSTPFYFAALMSFFNLLLLWFLFKETAVTSKPALKINPYHAVNIFISAFKDKNVKALSIIYFIFIAGWSSFYSFISVYLLKTYEFNATQISLYMAVIGIGFGIGNGFVGNMLAKRFTLLNNYIWMTLLSSMMVFSIIFIKPEWFNWIIVVPLGCTVSVAYAAILTLFSNQVDAASQGWVMGITGSIMAFVFALDGVIVGSIAAWSAILPMYIAAGCLLISVFCTYLFSKKIKIS